MRGLLAKVKSFCNRVFMKDDVVETSTNRSKEVILSHDNDITANNAVVLKSFNDKTLDDIATEQKLDSAAVTACQWIAPIPGFHRFSEDVFEKGLMTLDKIYRKNIDLGVSLMEREYVYLDEDTCNLVRRLKEGEDESSVEPGVLAECFNRVHHNILQGEASYNLRASKSSMFNATGINHYNTGGEKCINVSEHIFNDIDKSQKLIYNLTKSVDYATVDFKDLIIPPYCLLSLST